MEEHSPRIENMFLMVCGVVLFLYSWKKMDTAREDFENKFLEEPREK